MHILRRIVFTALVAGVSPLSGGYTASSPRLPLAFVENRGQAEPQVRYVGNGSEIRALFRDDAVEFCRAGSRISLRFVGGRPHPMIEPKVPIGAVANYFDGSDSRAWQTDLPMYRAVLYHDLWPGIDAQFKAEDPHPKSEYIVSPGASVSEIRLRFDGQVKLRSDGGITVSKAGEGGPGSELSEDAPVLYQDGPSGRVREVPGLESGRDCRIHR